jgi:ribosomal protein RSM22 (predicted rRNA methylase)
MNYITTMKELKELDKELEQELEQEHEKELDKELRGPSSVLARQKNPGRVEAGKRLQSLMKERRSRTSISPKNKYYIGAGVLVLFGIAILINKRLGRLPSRQNVEEPVLASPNSYQFDSDI